MDTKELTVPVAWLDDEALTVDELREIVTLGLVAFQSQQQSQAVNEHIEQALQPPT